MNWLAQQPRWGRNGNLAQAVADEKRLLGARAASADKLRASIDRLAALAETQLLSQQSQ